MMLIGLRGMIWMSGSATTQAGPGNASGDAGKGTLTLKRLLELKLSKSEVARALKVLERNGVDVERLLRERNGFNGKLMEEKKPFKMPPGAYC